MLLQKWDSQKGPYQVLLTTDIIAKFHDVDTWVCISKLKKAPHDIWSYVNTGELKIEEEK